MSILTTQTEIDKDLLEVARKIISETGLSGGSPGGGDGAGSNSTAPLVTNKTKPTQKSNNKGKAGLVQTNEEDETPSEPITMTEEQLLAEDFNNIHHFLTGGLKYTHRNGPNNSDIYERNEKEDGNPVKHTVRLSHNKDLKGHDTEEWHHRKITKKFLSNNGKMEDHSEESETHKAGHNKLRNYMLKVHGFKASKALKEEVLEEGKYSNAKKWLEKRKAKEKEQKGMKDKHFGEEATELNEISPPGWSGTMEAMMDKHGFSAKKAAKLAWYMYGKGNKHHYAPVPGHPGAKHVSEEREWTLEELNEFNKQRKADNFQLQESVEILLEKFGKRGVEGEGDTEDSKGDEADRHIVVQMRKAAGYKPDPTTKAEPHAHVLFRDNKSHPIPQEDAKKFLARHDAGTQEQKANLARVAEKSHKHFQAAIGKGPMPASYSATEVTSKSRREVAKGAWNRFKIARKKEARFNRLTARLDKTSK